MRIGVVLTGDPWQKGGGSTFEQSIANAILTTHSQHHYIFIDQEARLLEQQSRTGAFKNCEYSTLNLSHQRKLTRRLLGKALRLNNFFPQSKKIAKTQLINDRIKQHRFDYLWFLNPQNFNCDLPMAVTVWDLQHRLQPWFPEFNRLSIWPWNDREDHYEANLKRASLIIVGTERGKEEVAHYYSVSHQNILVNPLPVPSESMSTSIAEEQQRYSNLASKIPKNFFFYPAQFWPHKNHVNLLHALGICNQSSACPFHLILTGSDKGNLAHVKEAVLNLGLEKYVWILGFVAREDLAYLYRNAIALVFPSYFGPDNLPPLEAFLFGCPVLASAVEGSHEQLENAALFFNPSKPEEIAKSMLLVAKDRELRDALIDRGHKIASQRTASQYVKKVDMYFNDFAAITRNWSAEYQER